MLLRNAIIDAIRNGEIYISGAPEIDAEVKENTKAYKAFMEWADKYVRECSVDLPLGSNFAIERDNVGSIVPGYEGTHLYSVNTTGSQGQQFEIPSISPEQTFYLGPQRFVLGRSKDVVGLASTLTAVVYARSTASRWGVDVRGSAGLVDPGYYGPITFEIYNRSNRAMPLKPGARYAQLVFFRGEGDGRPYEGSYNWDKSKEWSPEMMLPKSIIDPDVDGLLII
jgi:deoxycytidine triphosphate deaminase